MNLKTQKMKNVILSLTILCSSMSYAQITGTLSVQLSDTNGAPAPGLNGIIEIFDQNQQLWLQTGVTSNNQGTINFTNNLPQAGFWVLGVWDNCTPITSPPSVSKTYFFGPNVPASGYNVTDTITVQCASTNCNFSVSAVQNTQASMTFGFSSSYIGSANSSHFWDFGDGNTSYAVTPQHTYTNSGTYTYCLTADTCTVCDTLVVTSNNAACMAEFIVDTVNSINGDVVLWNTSTLSSPNAAYQFTWDFGDGNFSNQDFPTHFYNQAGVYNVCLTLTEASGCTSTYCDSLGMDQNGNLIYKGQSTGFKLVVIDPATIGQEENLEDQVAIYPNPAEEILYINGIDQRGELIIQDLQGRVVRKEKLEAQQNELRIDELVKGVYIFQILSGDEQIRHIQIID